MWQRKVLTLEVARFPGLLRIMGDALVAKDEEALLDPNFWTREDHYYDPTEYPALFRKFADLETPEEILGFAQEFGTLEEWEIVSGPKTEENPEGEYSGEPLDRWRREISAMRKAIEIWDLLTAGDVKGLSRVLHIEREGTWYSVSHKEAPEEGSCPFSPPLIDVAARHYLQHVINKRLERYTHSLVLYDRDKGKLHLVLTARFLIGALWLQFAQAVDGAKDFRQCRECGTWYELTPDKNRTSKYYCSNACKQKAYRRRKAEARRLYAEGIPIEQIARRLESDLNTVTSWVKSDMSV